MVYYNNAMYLVPMSEKPAVFISSTDRHSRFPSNSDTYQTTQCHISEGWIVNIYCHTSI